MAYIYTLELKLAKQNASISLIDYAGIIDESILEYNNVGQTSTNTKSLKLINLEANAIILRLSSELELQAVGKALRYFSQLIIQKSPTLGCNITGSGQLFKINQIGIPVSNDSNADIQLQARLIDDATLIKSLIDYVCKKRDPNTMVYIKKQKALEQMKQLALEAGLIEL